MANYYYARVRTYLSTQSDALTASNITNNKVKADPILCADKSADGTSKKQYVWYLVDVYRSQVASFAVWSTLGSTQLGDLIDNDNQRKVEVSLPTKDTKYSTATDVSYYCNVGSVLHRDGHLEWTISNELGLPRSLKPIIKIYQDGEDTGTQTLIPNANILWDNTAKKQQTIKFTGAGGAPSFPTTTQTWLDTINGTGAAGKAYAKQYLSISHSEWSICNKLWYYMVVDSKEGTATLYSSDENGTKFTMVLGKKDAFTPEPSQPKKQQWNYKNNNAMLKALDASVCKGTAPTTVPPTTGADFNVDVSPPTDLLRWNPPPHSQSRSVPYHIRSGFYDNATTNPETLMFQGIQNTANFYNQAYRVESAKGYSYLERGRLFQDAESAAVLNSTNTTGKAVASGKAKQWGFRFMYNPTSVSYGTQANNSIDWTLGSKDTASLLAGNQTVSIQLLLNRVVDLSYLNALNMNNEDVTNRQLSMNAAYGRQLDPKEIEGILNRGTEYDLEFLYRCLAGDPQTNNPLLNDKLRKTGSADIGYITGIPLWLYLNDNMRYFGSVTGVDVNHLIFNTEMVPTLSYVTLSFSRYPAQFANDAASLKSVHDSFFPPATTGK